MSGYRTEMRNRDFQSKLEQLFFRSKVKFYCRLTSDSPQLVPLRLSPDQMVAIDGLSFGCLIHMHTFVKHLHLMQHTSKEFGYRTSLFKRDLYVRFLQSRIARTEPTCTSSASIQRHRRCNSTTTSPAGIREHQLRRRVSKRREGQQ